MPTVQRQYWGAVHKRAVKDAPRLLRIETTENAMIGILLTITAIAIVWLLGDHEIAEHTLIIRIASTVALICWFPFACPASAPMRQIRRVEEGRISGSS